MGKPFDPYGTGASASPSSRPEWDPYTASARPAVKEKDEDKAPETKEEADEKSAKRLEELRGNTEKIEQNPATKPAEAIDEMKGDKETAEQLEGWGAFSDAMVSLLAKLKRRNIDISLIKNQEDLQNKVAIAGLKSPLPEGAKKDQDPDRLTWAEWAAMHNLDRLTSEKGPTAALIMESWPQWLETSTEAAKGWDSKLFDSIKNNKQSYLAALLLGGSLVCFAWWGGEKLLATEDAADNKKKGKHWYKSKAMLAGAGLFALGALLGWDTVKKFMNSLGLDDELADKVQKGKELTAEEKKKVEEAGEKVKEEVEKRRKSKGGSGGGESTAEASGEGGAEGAGGGTEAVSELSEGAKEVVSEEIAEKHVLFEAATQALISIYCIDQDTYREIEPKIKSAFEFMYEVPLGKILNSYERGLAKGKKVTPEELGIPPNDDYDETALFHACAIVHLAVKGSKEVSSRFGGKSYDPDQKLVDFMSQLGTDPALGISQKLRESISKSIEGLSIHSFDDLMKAKEKIFDGKALDEVFDDKKEQLIEHMAHKYHIDLSSFTAKEKTDFLYILGELYLATNDFKLNQTAATIDKIASNRSANPKVIKATKDFFNALKSDIFDEPNGLRTQCITRYDIKRAENEKYDQVLKKYLKPDLFRFSDGLQMALLSEGIRFDKPSSVGGVDQAKDIAMLYLLLNILKKRDPHGGYPLYMGNLIDMARGGNVDLDINPNFAILAPYFNKLFGFALKKSLHWVTDFDSSIEAINDMNEREDKIEALARATTFEFMLETGASAAKGSYEIPKELVLTLYENFPEVVNKDTDGQTILKMIWALGGTLVYSEHDDKHLGLVYLFGKYFFIKPSGIAWDTVKAMALEGAGTSAKTYLIGASPFVTIGAVAGGGLAKWRHASVLAGTLRGAGRGLAAPVTLPITGYRWLRTISRSAKYVCNVAHHETVANMEVSANYFLRYNELVTNESSGFWQRVEAWGKKPGNQARKLLYEDVYQGMRTRWAHNFSANYNTLFDFNPDIKANPEAIAVKNKVLYSSGDFLKKVIRIKKFTERMRTLNIEELDKKALFRKFEEFGLNKEEIAAFERQVSHPKKGIGFEKFKAKMAKQFRPESPVQAPASARFRPIDKALTRPQELGNGKVRYMGEEFKLTEQEIKDAMRRTKGSRSAAIEKLCHKKWASPRFLSEGPAGRLYRYRGGEFVLSPSEYKGADARQIGKLCEAKYAETIAITEARVLNGVTEFKVGGKWMKAPEGSEALARARADFVESAKKAGYQFEFRDLSNTKLLKYWPTLKEAMGPAVAMAVIYHLETAQDKRKAVAETTIGLAAFWGGAKAAERATKFWTPKSVVGAIGKSGIVLATGLATAVGVTEPINDILEDLIPRFAGDEQITLELISVFEKYTARGIVLKGLHGMERKIASGALEKIGLKVAGELLNKKIGSAVLKKIAQFTSKSLLEKIGVSLGVRGAILAGLLVDDATVIGVLDDVVAVGMAAWMAKDIYDVAVLANTALKVKRAMEEYGKMAIENVEPATVADEKALEAALVTRGKSMEDLSGEELMEVIKSVPDIRIKITREGATGYEEYRFVKGEVYSTKIKDKRGEVLELSDEELNQDITLPPPEEFKTWEIDYNQPKEQLEANYRMAILMTKSECGWTKLDFETKDENTIVIKRLDGGQSLTIHRSGTTWSVENYSSGHTLFQAIVLANLTNKVHGILEKEDYSGGSDEPFSLDDGNIDFDKNWNPIDLRILAAETNWLAFYDKAGVSKEEVVTTLNAWYKSSSIGR